MMIIPQTGYPSNPEEGIPEGFTAALQPIAAQMVADLVSAEGSAGTRCPNGTPRSMPGFKSSGGR